MIEIRTKGNWTITGPVWVTGLPISGTGDFDYSPTFSTNNTGEYRYGTITIAIASSTYSVKTNNTITVPGENIQVPVIQYASPYMITGNVFILGLDADQGQKVKYSVTTNSNTQTNTEIACGESVYISGRQQTGIIPANGNPVTVRAYNPQTSTEQTKPFIPSGFGNAVYWMTSATPILSAEDVVAHGTLVAMTYNSGEKYYSGTFNATYGTGHTYFYIAFDYRNQRPCGSNTELTFDWSYYPVNVRLNYTAGTVGKSALTYSDSEGTNRISATYNGSKIIDARGEDTYNLVKYDADVNYLDVSVYSAGSTVTGPVTLGVTCPTTTSFTMVTTGYTSYSAACSSSTPTGTRYHNGGGTYPGVGDIVYTSGTTPMNGDNKYYKITAADVAVKIGTDGYVLESLACSCGAAAAPVVTSETFNVYEGSSHQIALTATNTPSVWRLTSSYNNYTVIGGAVGGNYSYTDINGVVINDSVGVGQSVQIVSNSAPTRDSGVTYTTDSVYVPYGVSIDNSGLLYISQLSSGKYSFSVIAENCFGTSSAQNIYVNVNHTPTLSPFKMSDEGANDGPAACSISGCEQTFWFLGDPGYPKVNDIVYIDGYGKDYFNGGYKYYRMDNNKNILIDGIGQVIQINNC